MLPNFSCVILLLFFIGGVVLRNCFDSVAATKQHPDWEFLTSRLQPLYTREGDIRSTFERDHTRIIHSSSYRRLKHKTQVFYSPSNDHICTRMEHVNHVESISYTLANYFGLNTELTKAISVAHDLGHSPFGHKGEKILSSIYKRDLGTSFWHEKNGLYLVDFLKLLEDHHGVKQNLCLSYAVRDGIVSHCGEMDENALRPRTSKVDLEKEYLRPNQFQPFTWEGCLVKIADKISYIGRDIEDAFTLGILADMDLKELYASLGYDSEQKINNTVLMNELIIDLCEHSSPENGLCFSSRGLELMNTVKAFNYEHIYLHPVLSASERYFSLVLNEIYNRLTVCFNGVHTLESLRSFEKFYPSLISNFVHWLETYADLPERSSDLHNVILYDLHSYPDYCRAVLSFISGMTDNFAIEMYREIISF